MPYPERLENLLSIREAAEAWNMPPATIQSALRRGALREYARKIGDAWIILPEGMYRWKGDPDFNLWRKWKPTGEKWKPDPSTENSVIRKTIKRYAGYSELVQAILYSKDIMEAERNTLKKYLDMAEITKDYNL